MKEKLEVIRLNLVVISIDFTGENKSNVAIASESLALLDSLIAELDSEELVEKAARGISNDLYNRLQGGGYTSAEDVFDKDESYRIRITNYAQAAINAIK